MGQGQDNEGGIRFSHNKRGKGKKEKEIIKGGDKGSTKKEREKGLGESNVDIWRRTRKRKAR